MNSVYISLIIAAVVTLICMLTASHDNEVETNKYYPIKIFIITLGVSFGALVFFSTDNNCIQDIEVGEVPF